MKDMDMLDFDDLLLLTVLLWRQHPEVLAEHQQRYQYILIDEYQDTNAAQFHLIQALAAEHQNICAVGDDDQSIYGWRGADVRNILNFEQHFPDTKVIRLEQNYRSTNNILRAANGVIAHNGHRHDKNLWSARGDGEKILMVSTANEEREANFVAEFIDDRRATRGSDFGDFAVLYRSNHQSRLLENALRQARIPYRIVGSRSFYERKEILDAVAFLRAVQNPRDNLSLLRILNVPPRGLGGAAITRLKELHTVTGLAMQELLGNADYLADLPPATAANVRQFHACLCKYRDRFKNNDQLSRTAAGLFEETGYLNGLAAMYKPREDAMRRRENVFEFINAVAEYQARHAADASLRQFLEEFTLMDDNDKVDEAETEQAVTLMTVHAAKGLEFPIVVVAGMEHGLFPHHQSVQDGGMEEERRLFYVAITRAQEELALLHADRRRLRGETLARRQSDFLQELPEEFIIDTDEANALRPASAEETADFLAQLKARFAPPA
jgi:superfamily I DNA/RNA helicase